VSTGKKISLVTVTYNSEKTIFKLLDSIKLIDNHIKEIIVIDNNSNNFDKYKIISISKKIKIIINKRNLGFAKAINQGIKVSKSSFILLLNPDTYLTNNSIKHSLDLIQKDQKIGAIGGKIFNQRNKISYTATNKPTFLTGLFEFTNLKKIFPNNNFSKSFWIEKKKLIKKPIKVTSLCGAYMIIRKKINNKFNLFNEKFFLYLEDIDFGIKINQNGYKVIFDPNSNIRHIGGASSKNKYKTDLKSWYKSRKIFFKLHLNKVEGIILSIIFSIEENILKIIHFIKNEPSS
jgi:GT2 family glycosyltransferase